MSSSSSNTDLIDYFDNTNDTDSFISHVTKNSFNSSNVDRHIYFAAKLYHYLDIPRGRAESIINDTVELIKDVIDGFKYDIINELNTFHEKSIENIKKIFEEKTPNLLLLIQNGAVCKYFNNLEHT